LVAYVVLDDDVGVSEESIFDTDQIKQFLRRMLPEYMIPSMIVVMNEMPLSPSGKVDKKALPAPDLDRSLMKSVYVEPRNDIERELVQICEELLGVDQVGVHDNFFELGGHSLLATQFISRVRESLSVELELRQLFETPTVAQIAEAIETSEAEATVDRTRIAELIKRINELSDDEVKELLELKRKAALETSDES